MAYIISGLIWLINILCMHFVVCPVLCNAWAEYKFTCVCVSVCPSYFLSTRLQVRPLNGFFTVDSLKDADLRKDVPFGGHDDK